MLEIFEGGTGKSVLVSYLADILNDKYMINILSRDMEENQRLSNDKSSNPNYLGDEPFMFYKQNPKVRVRVCPIEEGRYAKVGKIH